jgi:hypothetical protein
MQYAGIVLIEHLKKNLCGIHLKIGKATGSAMLELSE